MNELAQELTLAGKFLKVKQVQDQLNVSRALVYRLIETGELKAIRINHAIRVRQQDLDQFIQDHLIEERKE